MCGAACAAALAVAGTARAQDDVGGERVRTRVALGPQLQPSYPGSDSYDLGPLVEVWRARGDEPFAFEAADDSFGFDVVEVGGFAIGPLVAVEGGRSAEDVGTPLPKVKFSIEPGVSVSYNMSDSFRLRGEIRRGITGHRGWVGHAGADYVVRDGDKWLFSIGPRVSWSDNRYQDVWFGIEPADAPAAGLPAYDPDGGIHAYGASASFVAQFTPRWGIYVAAEYDRLVKDAAASPIVRVHGSRDQFLGGIGLTYTFGRGVD